MTSRPLLRALIDIVLIFLIIFGYWYIALPAALICAWVFPVYIELVILGFVYDALFGMGRGLGIEGYLITIVTAVVFGALSFSKIVVRK